VYLLAETEVVPRIPKLEMGGNLMIVLVVFVAVFLPVLFAYLKRRLSHKEILAAIEKGIPLAELGAAESASSTWIKSLTIGIALLIIGVGLACISLYIRIGCGLPGIAASKGFLIAVVPFAVGIAGLIRGLLQRKAEKGQNNIQPGNSADAGTSSGPLEN